MAANNVLADYDQNDIPKRTARAHMMDHVLANAEQGTQAAIAGLRVLGEVFETHAKEPQTRDSVKANVSRMLGTMYGIACTDAIASTATLAAYEHGYNPESKTAALVWSTIKATNEAADANGSQSDDLDVIFSPNSLAVIEDPVTHQLDIRFRYPRLRSSSGGHCPSINVKVETPEGKQRALPRFLSVLGDVAVSTIYPNRFEIVQ